MSHDTHSGHSKENKTIISFKNSFWLIIILVGLFIAALNFVQSESGGEGHEGAKSEEAHEMNGGEHAEKATEKAEAPKHEEAPAVADTAHKGK
jgi:hypothetical protein